MHTITYANLFQLADKLADVVFAAPVVATYRLCRFSSTGFTPSAQDREEMARMVDEKGRAFLDSWASIGVQAAVAGNLLSQGIAWAGLRPWSETQSDWRRGHQALIDTPEKGLDPIHQAVRANARRLQACTSHLAAERSLG